MSLDGRNDANRKQKTEYRPLWDADHNLTVGGKKGLPITDHVSISQHVALYFLSGVNMHLEQC